MNSAYVDVHPRVVPVGRKVELEVTCRVSVPDDTRAVARMIPVDRFSYDELYAEEPTRVADGRIHLSHTFPTEQAYLLRLYPEGSDEAALEVELYALKDDLLALRPCFCDFHMHTCFSDGLETPALRLAIARQRGLDCVVITDHNRYEGSTTALEALGSIPNRMVSMAGEEIHAGGRRPGVSVSPVHVLSLGSDYAIAPLKTFSTQEEYEELRKRLVEDFEEVCQKHPSLAALGREGAIARVDATRENRARLLEEAHRLGLSGSDAAAYAFTVDAFDEVASAHGVSVLCHALWRPIRDNAHQHRFDASLDLVEVLLDHRAFDAFEVASGTPRTQTRANDLHERLLREHCGDGVVPTLGVTDTHSSTGGPLDILGMLYTVALVDRPGETGVREAILDGRCVPVENYPGEEARVHASFRVARYVHFLIDHFLPVRRKNALAEGIVMERLARGGYDEGLVGALQALCASGEREETRWWWSEHARY